MIKLGDFIIKKLEDKKVQKWIISSDDFFGLCSDMGIINDDITMIDVMEYLEVNNIDINFHNSKINEEFYRRWQELENKLKLLKILNKTKDKTRKLIEKVDLILVKDRPDWMEEYRKDEDNNNEVSTSKIENPFQRITDMLTQGLRDRVENEPGITLEEIQREVDNEINNN